jgi:hypothetical protein
MAVFNCVNHGEFEKANATLRAFCAKCGRNCRRVYGKSEATQPALHDNQPTTGETQTTKTGGEPVGTNGGTNPKGAEGASNAFSESTGQPEIKVTRKVRVKVAKKKPEKAPQGVVKKKTFTGTKKPQIRVKVKTNRDKKLNKQEQTPSMWKQVKKASGWPGR